MRRTLAVLILLVVACSSDQELAPVPSTEPVEPTTTLAAPTTTSSVPTSTTTSQAATTTTTLPQLQGLGYEEVATVDAPIHMVGWDDGLSLLATKDGQVLIMEPDGELRPTPVLDISGQVHNEGERGLLGIAVHEDPNRLFVHYSDNNSDTVVSEFTLADGVFGEERILFTIGQPAANHNGGMLQFGSDGRLYLGLGDGGGADDIFGNGQNMDTLLSSLVAIDVESGETEKFQYGLRNPWRFWIDRQGGDLVYVADVGQNNFEEVSVASMTSGVNYGWPITEARHCFDPPSACDVDGITLPLVEVPHGDAGTCSITGGVVYRGAAIPELTGQFFFSDYCGGYLRSFEVVDGGASDVTDWTEQVGVAGSVLSFGTDFDGEMYVLTTDRVLKIVAAR